MSDEPFASSAPTTHAADGDNNGTAQRASPQARRERNRRAFNKKRETFLADLMRNVDILVYAELSTIYYMDCSFFRFLLRAFVQFVLLSPKSSVFPEPPQNRPIAPILATNLFCILLHLYLDRPDAGEATRRYMHGGLAMDFIGQKGPTSKTHLVLLDLLLLFLQLLCLGVLLTKRKAKEAANPTPAVATAPTPATTQTLDMEERGQHQSDHQPVDIELQDLNPPAGQSTATRTQLASRDDANDNDDDDDNDQGTERDRLLAATAPRSETHIFDAFNSGEIMIADLNLPRIVRAQILDYQNASPTADAAAASFSAARLAAGTGLGFRLRVGNSIWGV